MTFESLFQDAGKKLDELVKQAPGFYKENVEDPLNSLFDDLKEELEKMKETPSENKTGGEKFLLDVPIGDFPNDKVFVDLDIENNKIYIGIHGDKIDSLLYEVKLPQKINIRTITSSLGKEVLTLKGYFKETPVNDTERMVIISTL